MIAVSDSSPLITLAKLSRLALLPHLIPTVFITEEVHREIVGRGEGRAGSVEVASASWIHVRPVDDKPPVYSAAHAFHLGLGETSTIFLGKQLRADLLLIDETKARKVAAAFGFSVVGCVGLLEQLYLRGKTRDLRADFQQLANLSYVHVDLLNLRLRALHLTEL